jgi:DNA-directed RNA polymerase subunit RPC12/RpoP
MPYVTEPDTGGKCSLCGKPHGGQYFRDMETRELTCNDCQDAAVDCRDAAHAMLDAAIKGKP